MNTKYNLSLTATANYKGNEYEISFDPYNDCTDTEGLKSLLVTEIIDSGDFDEPIEETEIEIEITDFDEVPDKWANDTNLWEFAEAFAECDQDIDVVEAALECGVNASDIDEAYNGSYRDNEEFAQEMAEQLGAIDKNASWPQNCIDWEFAAKELMYDYSEHNGHYFRSL